MRQTWPLLALFLLAACGPPELPKGQRINGIDWILVGMDGLPWGADVSLRIDGDRLTGVGPCNAYSAAQAASPPGFSAQGLDVTALPCDDPLRNRAEAEYLHRLAQALGLEPAEVNGIHDQLGAQKIYG